MPKNDSTNINSIDADAAEASLNAIVGSCSPGDMEIAISLGLALVAEVRRLRGKIEDRALDDEEERDREEYPS